MRESERTELSESDVQAVQAELNRLLASTAFRNSKRCSEFLEYVVEHTLGGTRGALKERSLGVDLFHLPQDFDSGQHTVVRVTANEVRKKLAQHYLAENGSQHPVRISLPPGSYSAEFKWGTPVTETQVPSRPTPPARWVIACAAAVLAIPGAVLLWRWHATKPTSPGTSSVSAPGTVQNALPAGEDLRIGVGTPVPMSTAADEHGARIASSREALSSPAHPRESFVHWIRTFTGAHAKATFAMTFP